MEGKTVTSGQWLVGKGEKQWSVAPGKEDWKEGRGTTSRRGGERGEVNCWVSLG